MPNWVYNNITITGSIKDVETFYDKATAPHPDSFDKETGKVVYSTEVELSFWNFVAPPQDAVESGEYFGTNGWENGERKGDTPTNWYNWNNENWYTKWDACDYSGNTTINKKDKTSKLVMNFSTAWSIPEPVFVAMVEQHPELSFEFCSEEEQGWGAEFSGENGELVLTKEWGIPNCHTDYVERDNEDGCVCAWDEETENWYEDCPRKVKDFFVEITRTYKVIAENPEQAWELADKQVDSLVVDEFSTIIVKDENGVRLYPIPETDN